MDLWNKSIFFFMQNNISVHVHSLIFQSVFYEQRVILTFLLSKW